MESRTPLLSDVELGNIKTDDNPPNSESLETSLLTEKRLNHAIRLLDQMSATRDDLDRRSHGRRKLLKQSPYLALCTLPLVVGTVLLVLSIIKRDEELDDFHRQSDAHNNLTHQLQANWTSLVSTANNASCVDVCTKQIIVSSSTKSIVSGLLNTYDYCSDQSRDPSTLNCTEQTLQDVCQSIYDAFCANYHEQPADYATGWVVAIIFVTLICIAPSLMGLVAMFFKDARDGCIDVAVSPTALNIDKHLTNSEDKKFMQSLSRQLSIKSISDSLLPIKISQLIGDRETLTKIQNNQRLRAFLSVAGSKEGSENRKTPLFALFSADSNGQIRRSIVEYFRGQAQLPPIQLKKWATTFKQAVDEEKNGKTEEVALIVKPRARN